MPCKPSWHDEIALTGGKKAEAESVIKRGFFDTKHKPGPKAELQGASNSVRPVIVFAHD